MQNAEGFYAPEHYGLLWFFVGLALLVAVACWYGFVLWSTRRKPQPNVSKLPAQEPVRPDLATLKAKYLALIAQVEAKVSQQATTTRAAHQELSLLVRYFVYETNGFRAQVLSLSDIKHTDFTAIANVIERYYPAEFAALEQGDIAAAITTAKELVTAWS